MRGRLEKEREPWNEASQAPEQQRQQQEGEKEGDKRTRTTRKQNKKQRRERTTKSRASKQCGRVQKENRSQMDCQGESGSACSRILSCWPMTLEREDQILIHRPYSYRSVSVS